eukprot:g4302.t1
MPKAKDSAHSARQDNNKNDSSSSSRRRRKDVSLKNVAKKKSADDAVKTRRIVFKRGKLGIICAGRAIVKHPSNGTQAKTSGVRIGWRVWSIGDVHIPVDVTTEVLGEFIRRRHEKEEDIEIVFVTNYFDLTTTDDGHKIMESKKYRYKVGDLVDVLMMSGHFRGQWIPARVTRSLRAAETESDEGSPRECGIYDVRIADLDTYMKEYSGIDVPSVPHEYLRPFRKDDASESFSESHETLLGTEDATAALKKKKMPKPFVRYESMTRTERSEAALASPSALSKASPTSPSSSSSSSSLSTKKRSEMSSSASDVDVFCRIQQELDDRRMAERLGRRDSRLLTETIAKVSRERAKWMADDLLETCPLCKRPWDPVVLWKHHCRGCGTLVCDDCSANIATVVGYDEKERVCDVCFEDLTGVTNGGHATTRTRVCSTLSTGAVRRARNDDDLLRVAIAESLRQASTSGASTVATADAPPSRASKVTDASTASDSPTASPSPKTPMSAAIEALCALGFGWSKEECRAALEKHGGDMDASTEFLLRTAASESVEL